jgi:uncharacterized membrane protein YgdD (TMEM256/DUF423 family)
MSPIAQRWLIAGALAGGFGVILGAYSAHGLNEQFVRLGYEGEELAHRHANFETAVRYQMIHALAIVAVALALDRYPRPAWRLAAWAFLVGIMVFSGLLYILALASDDFRWLGAIVPIGGLLLVAGWMALAFGAMGRDSFPS